MVWPPCENPVSRKGKQEDTNRKHLKWEAKYTWIICTGSSPVLLTNTGSMKKQETISKCYTFLKEMFVRASAKTEFVGSEVAEYCRCTPLYGTLAIEKGLFTRLEGKLIQSNIIEVTLAHAEFIVREANKYSRMAQNPRKKTTVGSTEVKQKEDPEVVVHKIDPSPLSRVSDVDLVEELRSRGYSGELQKIYTL